MNFDTRRQFTYIKNSLGSGDTEIKLRFKSMVLELSADIINYKSEYFVAVCVIREENANDCKLSLATGQASFCLRSTRQGRVVHDARRRGRGGLKRVRAVVVSPGDEIGVLRAVLRGAPAQEGGAAHL